MTDNTPVALLSAIRAQFAGTLYEIPLSPSPQRFSTQMAGVPRLLRVTFREVEEGGWLLDIGDTTGTPLLMGVPLLPGQNLLEQYEYLGLGGALFLITAGDLDRVPGFIDLGVSSKLYFAEA